MSNAKLFLNHVQADKALQDRLNAADWDTKTAAQIAAEAGFKLSADEIQSAMDEMWGDLSESDLKHMAGGDGGHGGGDDNSGRVANINLNL